MNEMGTCSKDWRTNKQTVFPIVPEEVLQGKHQRPYFEEENLNEHHTLYNIAAVSVIPASSVMVLFQLFHF